MLQIQLRLNKALFNKIINIPTSKAGCLILFPPTKNILSFSDIIIADILLIGMLILFYFVPL